MWPFGSPVLAVKAVVWSLQNTDGQIFPYKFYSWAISLFTCVFLLARQFSVHAHRRRNTQPREQRHKGNISLSSIRWDRQCLGWFECLYEVSYLSDEAAAEYMVQRQRFDSRNRPKSYLFFEASIPAMGPTNSPIQWVPRTLYSELKGQEVKLTDHSPPSSAEVKNERSYTSGSAHVFMAGTRTKFLILLYLTEICFEELIFVHKWQEQQESGNNFVMKFTKQGVSFTVSLSIAAVTGYLEERTVCKS